jgi:Fe-S-cluster-containing dehydrogenase component
MGKISLLLIKRDCMGCHACEIACKQEHNLGVGPRLVRVLEASSDFIPIYCHHCTKAACLEACPVAAISRNEQGIVLIDGNLCIGCKDCLAACPYGAMQFADNQEIAVKCDLCVHRLAESKPPACMSVCPTGCIRFGGRKNIADEYEKTTPSEE